MKLLCHISSYENKRRIDNKHGIEKGCPQWQRRVLEGIHKILESIKRFNSFDRIHVFIDSNIENKSVDLIDDNNFKNLELTIRKFDFSKEHPFLLTSKHRQNIEQHFDDFDYFMYLEDDTFVPAETVETVVPVSKENKAMTLCYHLGYCGKYYFRHQAGFHCLPY